ncbi:putative serine carboxypeptidase CPVL isoform X1 [Amblyomma americanum]
MQAVLLLLLFTSNFSFGANASHQKLSQHATKNGAKKSAHKGHTSTSEVNEREPLLLTPLIEAGQYDEALERSRVGSLGDVPDVLSYSGFITVNKELGSNLFFWFVLAMENPDRVPVMLWLQGGPGTSSLMGLFVEHGPYYVDENYAAQLREITWTRTISVLYVDNPVGTGFSFTQSDDGYARNMSDVSRDMLEFLQQFFTLFDNYSSNDFYLAGESYAGKYVSAIGAALHQSRGELRVSVHLKGLSIGNGVIDSKTMLIYGHHLYEIGLMDRRQAAYMQKECDLAAELIREERYTEASSIMMELFLGTILGGPTYFENVTGYDYVYNYLITKKPESHTRYEKFVHTSAVRHAIHVGGAQFSENKSTVVLHFKADLMKSVRDEFALLIDNYKALHYSGQLDIAVPYTATEAFMSSLQWSGAQEFASAPQQIWRSADGDEVLGYVKKANNFTMVLVRNGGHILPYDQPEVASELISGFVNGVSFVV